MKDSSKPSLPKEESTPIEPVFSKENLVSKDYEKALERISQALEQRQPSTTLEKVLFGIGLSLCFILSIPLCLEWLSYPYWLELFYDFSIFVEASLPLVLSFFLKNKQQATILQIAGTVVLLMYVLSYF